MHHQPVGIRSMAKEWASLLQELDVRPLGFPTKGLQVMTLAEVRNVPVKVFIVLGCLEGNFPKGLPRDRVLDDRLKQTMGLPGWAYVEAMEETTFHILCSQAQSLCLLYPVGKGDNVRSRFVERVLHHPHAVFKALSFQPSLWPKAQTAPDKSLWGRYTGDRKALVQNMSASRLRDLLRCPFRFMVQSLGLRETLPEETKEAMEEGQKLHAILARAITSPQMVDESLHEEAMVRILEDCTDRELEDVSRKSPLRLHLRTYAWPKMADHWRRLFLLVQPKQRIPELRVEGSFLTAQGLDPSALLGSIDLAMWGRHGSVLVDYKRKRVVAKDDVQLAVYAHAMQQLYPELDLDQQLLGYMSILEGVWYPYAVGDALRDEAITLGFATTKTPSTRKVVESVVGQWRDAAREHWVELKDFAPRVNDDCERCGFQSLCRVSLQEVV
jgi:hypothetical protein